MFLAFGGVGFNQFIAYKTLHVCPWVSFKMVYVIQLILLLHKQFCLPLENTMHTSKKYADSLSCSAWVARGNMKWEDCLTLLHITSSENELQTFKLFLTSSHLQALRLPCLPCLVTGVLNETNNLPDHDYWQAEQWWKKTDDWLKQGIPWLLKTIQPIRNKVAFALKH